MAVPDRPARRESCFYNIYRKLEALLVNAIEIPLSETGRRIDAAFQWDVVLQQGAGSLAEEFRGHYVPESC